jgi:hypothetical protein
VIVIPNTKKNRKEIKKQNPSEGLSGLTQFGSKQRNAKKLAGCFGWTEGVMSHCWKKRKPDHKRRFSTFHLVVVLCLFIPFFAKCIGDKEQTVVKVKSNF